MFTDTRSMSRKQNPTPPMNCKLKPIVPYFPAISIAWNLGFSKSSHFDFSNCYTEKLLLNYNFQINHDFLALIKTFYLGIILDLQNSCKGTIEFPCSFHQIPPKISILHYHGTFVTTKKRMLVHYYWLNYKLYLDFTCFFTSIFFQSWEPSQGTTLHLIISF